MLLDRATEEGLGQQERHILRTLGPFSIIRTTVSDRGSEKTTQHPVGLRNDSVCLVNQPVWQIQLHGPYYRVAGDTTPSSDTDCGDRASFKRHHTVQLYGSCPIARVENSQEMVRESFLWRIQELHLVQTANNLKNGTHTVTHKTKGEKTEMLEMNMLLPAC